MTDELKQWDYDRGYDKGKADMLKVIEDIKAEIIKWIEMDGGSYEYDSGLRRALCIIDKHIGKENK